LSETIIGENVMGCEICGKEVASPIRLTYDGEHTFCCHDCVIEYISAKGLGPASIKRQRNEVIHQIEVERKSKLITMIHRIEHDGEKAQYITIEDAEDIIHEIRSTPENVPIDFLIHCSGGLVLPAEQIAMAMKERKSPTTVIVPHYAMSGATLIALAAKEILMDSHSVLGSLDPQIQGLPSPSLLKLLEYKKPEFIRDEMLIAIDIASKSISQMRNFIKYLLRERMGEDKSSKVAEFLTGGYMTHDKPITAKDAALLGLPVRVGIPENFYNLLRLYKFVSDKHDSMYSKSCPCL